MNNWVFNQIVNNLNLNQLNKVVNDEQVKAGEVIVGRYYNRTEDGSKRAAEIRIINAVDLGNESLEDWDLKAAASLEAIFRPVSKYGDGALPRYAQDTGVECVRGITYGANLAHPPFILDTGDEEDVYQDTINLDECDPYPPSGEGITRGTHSGHDLDMFAYDTGSEDPLSAVIRENVGDEVYPEDFRFIALKGPIVLQQWGLDINGKPIPNQNDDEEDAKQGIYNHSNVSNAFMDDWLTKPETWPVGVLDLAWDRKRRMWVMRPPYKMIYVVLNGAISSKSTGTAYIENTIDLFTNEGSTIYPDETEVSVYNATNEDFNAGARAFCYYDTDEEVLTIITAANPDEDDDPVTSMCTGRCKWLWVDSTKLWTNISDPNPCSLIFNTTTPVPGCLDSRTTTPRPCQCLYPGFCGDEDGDITYTICNQITNNHPDCGSGTTPCPPCVDPGVCEGECTFLFLGCVTNGNIIECEPGNVDNIYGGWILLCCGCSAVTIGTCGCDVASLPAEGACNECATVDCIYNPPDSDPPCIGYCQWIFIPVLQAWIYVTGTCPTAELYPNCQCFPPDDSCYWGSHGWRGVTCNTEDPCGTGDEFCPIDLTKCGEECFLEYTDCQTVGCPTVPCGTTLPPCAAGCRFVWTYIGIVEGYEWAKVQDCPVSCPCADPISDGTDEGEIKIVPCNSATTPPPTTTTTTTTTAVPTGACCAAFDSPVCLITTADECAGEHAGLWQGPGTVCSPNPCITPCEGNCFYSCVGGTPVLVGNNCNFANPSCDCDNTNPGTCSDSVTVPCGGTTTTTTTSAPLGKCCFIDGSCARTTEATCTGAGGSWNSVGWCPPLGPGCPTTTTTTTTTTIAPATGGCCVDGVCTNGVTSADCGTSGGIWWEGQSCGSFPCEA